MGEHLLVPEHADYFMEKVMEIITMVKVDPKEALALAKQQAEAASALAATTTTVSTTVTSGAETPITSPTTSRKTSTANVKADEAETTKVSVYGVAMGVGWALL